MPKRSIQSEVVHAFAEQVEKADAFAGEELRKTFLKIHGCGPTGWQRVMDEALELRLAPKRDLAGRVFEKRVEAWLAL